MFNTDTNEKGKEVLETDVLAGQIVWSHTNIDVTQMTTDTKRTKKFFEENRNKYNPYHAILNAFEHGNDVMSTGQIAEYTNMHISTATYYLNKMEDLGAVIRYDVGNVAWVLSYVMFTMPSNIKLRTFADFNWG